MSNPSRLVGTLLLLLALPQAGPSPSAPDLPGVGPAAAEASLMDLTADAAGQDLYASFALRDAFSEDVRQRLSAGLPVTFTYYLEVARRRPFWFDKPVARKTVSTTVTYDTLTRQYRLSKSVNDEVTETSVAVSEADMVRWMTRLDRVRLADPSALGRGDEGSLYVRVKSRLQRRFVLLFIPWDIETGWERVRIGFPVEGAVRDP